ncbi:MULTISPECIES: hypothetical protein [unclassified Kitasatospora]|uniref:hypothetical protein n=1 Tax=unclassified Kitasatospora TaxID=2633591 RepID=UPI0033C5A052
MTTDSALPSDAADIPELAASIAALNREEVFEAVLALGDLLTEDTPEQEALSDLMAEVERNPYAMLPDVEDLARILLLTAAGTEEWRTPVTDAVGSAGRKAFVFGGLEIVAVGALAVAGLAVVLARGKAEERTTMELDENGKLRYEREVVYTSGSGLVRALAKFLGTFRQP